MKKVGLIIAVLLLASVSWARQAQTQAMLNIREADGSPSTYPYQFKLPNGSLTDNGDGTATFSVVGISIISTNTLQSGTTFFVSSGTVSTQLNVPNGTISGNAAAYGQLQYLQTTVIATVIGSTSTSSTSFVPSNLTASITPTSTSSRIKISGSFTFLVNGTVINAQGIYSLFRGVTNLGDATAGMNEVNQQVVSQANIVPASVNWIDSPATTSLVTYTIYFRVTNASDSTNIGNAGIPGTLILEEIR